MRLVYIATRQLVEIGDRVKVAGVTYVIESCPRPHKPASSGRMVIRNGRDTREYYVGVLGAEWIEREDRDVCPTYTDSLSDYAALPKT